MDSQDVTMLERTALEIRDSMGISKLALIQLTLLGKISYISSLEFRGSLEFLLLSLLMSCIWPLLCHHPGTSHDSTCRRCRTLPQDYC